MCFDILCSTRWITPKEPLRLHVRYCPTTSPSLYEVSRSAIASSLRWCGTFESIEKSDVFDSVTNYIREKKGSLSLISTVTFSTPHQIPPFNDHPFPPRPVWVKWRWRQSFERQYYSCIVSPQGQRSSLFTTRADGGHFSNQPVLFSWGWNPGTHCCRWLPDEGSRPPHPPCKTKAAGIARNPVKRPLACLVPRVDVCPIKKPALKPCLRLMGKLI